MGTKDPLLRGEDMHENDGKTVEATNKEKEVALPASPSLVNVESWFVCGEEHGKSG